jgi:hypothetical protein
MQNTFRKFPPPSYENILKTRAQFLKTSENMTQFVQTCTIISGGDLVSYKNEKIK